MARFVAWLKSFFEPNWNECDPRFANHWDCGGYNNRCRINERCSCNDGH